MSTCESRWHVIGATRAQPVCLECAPTLTPDEVEVGRQNLIAELGAGLIGAPHSVYLQPDSVREIIAVLEALKPVVVDREAPHYLNAQPGCTCFDGGSTWHDGAMATEYHLEPNPDCPAHFPKAVDRDALIEAIESAAYRNEDVGGEAYVENYAHAFADAVLDILPPKVTT